MYSIFHSPLPAVLVASLFPPVKRLVSRLNACCETPSNLLEANSTERLGRDNSALFAPLSCFPRPEIPRHRTTMSWMHAAVVIPALHMPPSNQRPIAPLGTQAKPTASSRSSQRAANFSPGAIRNIPRPQLCC